jgi:hypothetical protein
MARGVVPAAHTLPGKFYQGNRHCKRELEAWREAIHAPYGLPQGFAPPSFVFRLSSFALHPLSSAVAGSKLKPSAIFEGAVRPIWRQCSIAPCAI